MPAEHWSWINIVLHISVLIPLYTLKKNIVKLLFGVEVFLDKLSETPMLVAGGNYFSAFTALTNYK